MIKNLATCALIVAGAIFPLGAQSQARQQAPVSLLVQYREVVPTSKAAVSAGDQSDLRDFEKQDAGQYGFASTKWRTLWTNGTSKNFTRGLIFASQDHLYTMIPVWATTGKKRVYSKILLTPVHGGKTRTIWSNEVDDSTAADPERGGGPTTESIEILSVCGDWFGASIHSSNGVAEHEQETWQTFRVVGLKALESHELNLPPGVVSGAERKLSALPQSADISGGVTVDDSQFVIAPHGIGICAEFVASEFPTVPTLLYARMAVNSLKPFSAYISSPSLVKAKFGLDQSKFDLLTVAPDQSAVAYVKNRMIYWKKAQKPSVLLGSVEDVRGFQWLSPTSETLLNQK